MEKIFSKESVLMYLEDINKDLLAIDTLLFEKSQSYQEIAKSHVEELNNLELKLISLQEKEKQNDSKDMYPFSNQQKKCTLYLNLAK